MNFDIVSGRRNVIKELLFNFFFAISSWPRLLLEVFTRKNFGERYFSFSSAIILTVVLAIIPMVVATKSYVFQAEHGTLLFLRTYLTWYIFLVGFLYVCVKRRNEIRRLPSVFDFARYSKSPGIIDPRFFTVKVQGCVPSVREVATRLEPGFFFAIGICLSILGQAVGGLLVQCSILYALSYRASYYQADQRIMDAIDKFIINEEWASSFVDGLDPSKTRGFSAIGRRPADREQRQRIADAFTEKEEIVEAL